MTDCLSICYLSVPCIYRLIFHSTPPVLVSYYDASFYTRTPRTQTTQIRPTTSPETPFRSVPVSPLFNSLDPFTGHMSPDSGIQTEIFSNYSSKTLDLVPLPGGLEELVNMSTLSTPLGLYTEGGHRQR